MFRTRNSLIEISTKTRSAELDKKISTNYWSENLHRKWRGESVRGRDPTPVNDTRINTISLAKTINRSRARGRRWIQNRDDISKRPFYVERTWMILGSSRPFSLILFIHLIILSWFHLLSFSLLLLLSSHGHQFSWNSH